MQFFFDEIVARIVANYLFVYCGRKLWYGLVERKIAYWNDDFIDWLLVDWSRVVAHRDATPAVRALMGIPYRGRTRNRI